MSSGNRLSSHPFSVLLPKIGDLAALGAYKEFIEERLASIRGEENAATQTDIQSRLGEESMLLQVLQWLTMGEETKE